MIFISGCLAVSSAKPFARSAVTNAPLSSTMLALPFDALASHSAKRWSCLMKSDLSTVTKSLPAVPDASRSTRMTGMLALFFVCKACSKPTFSRVSLSDAPQIVHLHLRKADNYLAAVLPVFERTGGGGVRARILGHNVAVASPDRFGQSMLLASEFFDAHSSAGTKRF